MLLSELKIAVDTATKNLATQDAYVQELGAKVTAGEKTIRVYDDALKVWTDIKLLDFWQIQYDKYIAMAGYAGDMNGLLSNLQSALDAALPGIALPEDRIKDAAAKKVS